MSWRRFVAIFTKGPAHGAGPAEPGDGAGDSAAVLILFVLRADADVDRIRRRFTTWATRTEPAICGSVLGGSRYFQDRRTRANLRVDRDGSQPQPAIVLELLVIEKDFAKKLWSTG